MVEIPRVGLAGGTTGRSLHDSGIGTFHDRWRGCGLDRTRSRCLLLGQALGFNTGAYCKLTQSAQLDQRLHRRMPERALGLEMLSPDPDLRLQPLRLVGSPQALQCRLLDRHRRELVGPFGPGM